MEPVLGIEPGSLPYQGSTLPLSYTDMSYPKRDSNSHAFRHLLLRQACLPFHHSGM